MQSLRTIFYTTRQQLPFFTGGVWGWVFLCLLLFTSCSKEELDSQSVFVDRTTTEQPFDKWIYENYVMPYNIELKYHLEDRETDFQYTLVPALTENSIKVAHVVLYCWLEAYDEVAGVDFTRQYVPKIIQLVGSNAHNK